MKKIIIMVMLLAFGVASVAMAANPFTGAIGTQTDISKATLVYSTSTNVYLGYANASNSYAAETKHTNGSRCFGGSSNSTSLMYDDTASTCGPAVTLSAAPQQSDSAAFSSWSSL
jgi:hypothetical protein